MEPSKLSDHLFKKGKFTTPLNSLPMMKELENEKSWTYGRLPEYLWIGVILNKYGRQKGLEKIYYIIKKLHELAPQVSTPRISEILKLDQYVQEKFYKYLIEKTSKNVLSCLTLIFTYSKYKEFATMFCNVNISIEERQNELLSVMQKNMGHQTNEATDIRFVVLYYLIISGKIQMPKEIFDEIILYPELDHSADEMRMIRPTIRATELSILELEIIDSNYLSRFWRCISEMTDCSLFAIKFPEDNTDINLYLEHIHEIFQFLYELYVNCDPLDDKMNVIIGIATYSYKRFNESYEHKLFNSISGRSCVRVLIENYIMLKYLIKHESDHDNIWRDYKLYGMGLYKLVLARNRENDYREQSHFDMNYVEALVNEFVEEEFINMDTRYFDQQNVRIKADDVGEKELFGLYYDYDSSYEHGLWGAIRESSLIKCSNPAHQYHCVPDVENANILKSVLPDCIMIMNKLITLLNDLYGLPKALYEEVVRFEI